MKAKDIIVKPISSRDGSRIVKTCHYSGKIVSNSQLHLGVFLGSRCGGAMQFGPSMDKSKMLGLVSGTSWNGFLELNRMAFADWIPRNSESRALGVAFRIIKKKYPHVEWVVSFADATQCGDGAIYRASGFVLTSIRRSLNLVRLPSGEVVHKMTLESGPTRPRPELGGRSYYGVTGGRYDLKKYAEESGGAVVPGFQLRYIRFLKPGARERLTVPVIPFSKIDEVGAGMYLGKPTRAKHSGDAPGIPVGGGRFDSDPCAPADD